jgi:porphobilinogen synthase
MPQPTHLPRNPGYPTTRMRRLRQAAWVRYAVAENRLSPADLIQPFFIADDDSAVEDVPSMPGVKRYGIDHLLRAVERCMTLSIPIIALFPVTPDEAKTIDGEEAMNENNLICRAMRAIKSRFPNIGILADVALDPYTSHGQDGIVRDGVILNDETLEALSRQAMNQAAAGADIIAPSDMMDGRIGVIRGWLDKEGFENTMIMAYAAKYASAFYGPFRDAVGSSSALGKADKRTYQMNPANAAEAIQEVALDLEEGADMVMVKPGLPYLDVIYRVKHAFQRPTFAYHVSGEYSMLKAAGERGWLDAEATMLESLIAFKRAGADGILTYAAMDIAEKL